MMQWQWLTSTDSLTERLRQSSNRTASMQLLRAEWSNALDEEKELFAPFPAENAGRFWLREIIHVYQQQPWIWGRVIIPEKTLQITKLDGQSPQPIGDVLFNDPHTTRDQLSLARLSPQHLYYQKVQSNFLAQAELPLWSRRSIIWFKQQPLLIAEVFLPEFFNYADHG